MAGLDFAEPSVISSLQEQAKQLTVLSEFAKASMSLSDLLAPTLTDKLTKLNNLYPKKIYGKMNLIR